MSNVYIINRGCHDYTKAEKYGTLIYLTEGYFRRFSTGKMYRAFLDGFENSQQSDYIVIGGLTIMATIACSVFATKHGRLNLLLYNNNRDVEDYVKRTIVLEDLQ